MPEKSPTAGSKMSSNKCACCPYGFHIDRDFVRFCDSLYNTAQLDKLRQHKRERRKEKKSVESYLGLSSLKVEVNDQKPKSISHQNSFILPAEHMSTEYYLQSDDDLKNAVSDFEDTWRKSLKKNTSSHSIDNRNGIKHSENLILHSVSGHDNSQSSGISEDRENKISSFHSAPSRSSSLSSVSSQSTNASYIVYPSNSEEFCSSFLSRMNSSLSSLSKPITSMSQQTVGIHKSVLTNIREQMASSLHHMKELEEQVKTIPALKGKLSTLYNEKKSLLNEIKLKENMIFETKKSSDKELEKHLKKLENEGIMSPTLSRRCLSLRHYPDNLFSPGIASSLDASMTKKSFIQNEILSHLKMNDLQDMLDKHKNRKSTGTSCAVLTRDIGVGYVPSKFKSVAVGSDLTLNSLNLLNKQHLEKPASVSSESIESDLDSLSGIDIPKFSTEYSVKPFSSNETFKKIEPSKNVLVDSCTNTEFHAVDKSVNTDAMTKTDVKISLPQKFFKHKGISVSQSMSNKYVQVPEKYSTKHVGMQTTLENKVSVHQTKSVHDVGVGDYSIKDVLCSNCKKIKKSVAVGDFDIKNTVCNKCRHDGVASLPKLHSIGTGDFDVKVPYCEKCQKEKATKHEKRNMCSIGTNTSVELSISRSDIHICDKCNETIQSVAEDLAANPTNTDISKSQVPKTKLSKLKSEIKPLKITHISSTTTWTAVKETKHKNSELHVERKKTESSVKTRDDEDATADIDNTSEGLSSSEILPHFTNLPAISRKKKELSKEVKAACKVLNDDLQKSNLGSQKKSMSSLTIIQNEWFKVANQKKANPHLIEDYLDAFEEFSKLLLHKIVNLSDTNGNTALHYAVSYGNFDVVSILIDSKVCDVNLKNKAGYTSIMLVALAEMRNDAHHYVVQRLFSIGDINIKASQNGQTALMLAVSHGKKDIVKLLLEVGAEINLQDKDGSTALMCAAEHGHLDLAKILLSHSDCDPTIVDNDGCNALTIAMEAGHKDIGLLIYTNMNFSRGSSPYSTLKSRKRSTPRSTPPPHTPTLRTPPLPSPATKSLTSLSGFQFPN